MSVLRMLIPPKRLDVRHLNCLFSFLFQMTGVVNAVRRPLAFDLGPELGGYCPFRDEVVSKS
jgi:hypothetical protein